MIKTRSEGLETLFEPSKAWDGYVSSLEKKAALRRDSSVCKDCDLCHDPADDSMDNPGNLGYCGGFQQFVSLYEPVGDCMRFTWLA